MHKAPCQISQKKNLGVVKWAGASRMPCRAAIPAMRIPAQLEEWHVVEAEKRGLKVVDMARMLLLDAMRTDDGTNSPN